MSALAPRAKVSYAVEGQTQILGRSFRTKSAAVAAATRNLRWFGQGSSRIVEYRITEVQTLRMTKKGVR